MAARRFFSRNYQKQNFQKYVFFVFLGYQKTKAEEAKILESLREEGLLAKPKGKTAGGMAFEVVDSSVVEKQQDFEGGKDAFVTAEFMPSKTLKRLELRRGVSLYFDTLLYFTEIMDNFAAHTERVNFGLFHSNSDFT